jgi:hypothetical protein
MGVMPQAAKCGFTWMFWVEPNGMLRGRVVLHWHIAWMLVHGVGLDCQRWNYQGQYVRPASYLCHVMVDSMVDPWITISTKIDWFLQKPIKLIWTDFVGSPKTSQFDLIFFWNFWKKENQKNQAINWENLLVYYFSFKIWILNKKPIKNWAIN